MMANRMVTAVINAMLELSVNAEKVSTRNPGDQHDRGDHQRESHGTEGVAHRVFGAQAFFAARAQVLAEKMHRIIDHDTERHAGDDRQCEANLADD